MVPKQSDDTFIVTYQNNLGQNTSSSTPGNTCKGKLIDGALFVTNAAETGSCFNQGLYGMKRLSKQCFVWEVTNSFPLASATSCQKKSPAPLALFRRQVSIGRRRPDQPPSGKTRAC